MTLALPSPIDFAIITIKEEEFDAVLRRYPPDRVLSGLWEYNLCTTATKDGLPYTVATVRCLKQATNEAQSVTGYIIEDLDPRWILLAGIAGAIPAAEYTLGDVVISTRIYDLNVGAHVPGQHQHYAITADSIHEDVAPVVANLRAYDREFEGWNSEASIGRPRPEVSLEGLDDRLNGDTRWKQKVRASVLRHFGPEVPDRPPLYTAGPLASSDDLIKDPSVLQRWQTHARDIYAVEMEASGVHRGARRRGHTYPFVSIRGLSDVVGLERDHAWTEYACETSAAFTRVFTDLVAPRIARPTTPGVTPGGPIEPAPAPAARPSSRPRLTAPGTDPVLVSHALQAQEVIEEYVARPNLEPAEAVQAILRRLNLPWKEPLDAEEQDLLTETMLMPGVSYPSPDWVLERLADVPDFLGCVADAIRAAARWPESYRLNYVRQLSTTNLTRSLGAGHTRLAHCLGTLDVATVILARLSAGSGGPLDLADREAQAWVLATQLFAFLHDRYHGPLGHSLDPLAWMLTRAPGAEGHESALRQLDKAELESQVRAARRRSSHPIRRLVDFVVSRLPDLYGPLAAPEVLSRLHKLVQLGRRSSVPAAWRFLRDIVDGELDADRLDYIWRDANHLSLPTAELRQLQSKLQFPAGGPVGAFVDSVRVVPDAQGGLRLAFGAEHADVAAALLALRFGFYVHFYEHPHKRVYDELITRTIQQALDDSGCLHEGRVPEEVSRELRTLTDPDLFHFLFEISTLGGGPDRTAVARATQDVLQARPWTMVWELALDAPALERVHAHRAARARLVEALAQTYGDSDVVRASRRAQGEVAEAARAGELPPLFARFDLPAPEAPADLEAAPVVDFHLAFGATFEVLRAAEQDLWVTLEADVEMQDALRSYRDAHCLGPDEPTPCLIVMGVVTAEPPSLDRLRLVGAAGPSTVEVTTPLVFQAFVAAHPKLLVAEDRLRAKVAEWFEALRFLSLAG